MRTFWKMVQTERSLVVIAGLITAMLQSLFATRTILEKSSHLCGREIGVCMKMQMVLRFRDGKPDETRYYNTVVECDMHLSFISKYRNHEIESVLRGRVGSLQKAKLIEIKEGGCYEQK